MKSKQSAFVSSPVLLWAGGLLLINTLILDVIFIRSLLLQKNVLGTSTAEACPSACITRINQMAGKTVSSAAKEYYVPLGSGSGATDDWADVTGASAYIDTASYGKLKAVTFEATVTVPSGSQKVYVRLYNATDKHPVWFSDVSTDLSGPVLLTSKGIVLDKGNKLYQVQMKTQLKNLTNLVQSRVRIMTY